jgi:hypothetical protein
LVNFANLSSDTVQLVAIDSRNPTDTIYNSNYPYGAHSCAGFPGVDVFTLYVSPVMPTGDTAVTIYNTRKDAPFVMVHVLPGLRTTVEHLREGSC